MSDSYYDTLSVRCPVCNKLVKVSSGYHSGTYKNYSLHTASLHVLAEARYCRHDCECGAKFQIGVKFFPYVEEILDE